ncbi:hypothetical protein HY745_04210 [Candidatus Desantisbacteria bacterium]|nr:hypothetical protein [Candidatus Desantisbacteria bacterium]
MVKSKKELNPLLTKSGTAVYNGAYNPSSIITPEKETEEPPSAKAVSDKITADKDESKVSSELKKETDAYENKEELISPSLAKTEKILEKQDKKTAEEKLKNVDKKIKEGKPDIKADRKKINVAITPEVYKEEASDKEKKVDKIALNVKKSTSSKFSPEERIVEKVPALKTASDKIIADKDKSRLSSELKKETDTYKNIEEEIISPSLAKTEKISEKQDKKTVEEKLKTRDKKIREGKPEIKADRKKINVAITPEVYKEEASDKEKKIEKIALNVKKSTVIIKEDSAKKQDLVDLKERENIPREIVKLESREKDTIIRKDFDTIKQPLLFSSTDKTVKEIKINKKNEVPPDKDNGKKETPIKIKRTIDRNVKASAGKKSPLTIVSVGGSVREVEGKIPTIEEVKMMKKVMDKIEKGEIPLLVNKAKVDDKIPDMKKESGNLKEEENKILSEIEAKVAFKIAYDKGQIPIEKINDNESLSQIEKLSQEGLSEKVFSAGNMEKGNGRDTGTMNEKKLKESGASEKSSKKIDQHLREIVTKIKNINADLSGYPPNITLVTHNGILTLGLGDELEVTLEGDAGKTASFDIGLYKTKNSMIEVSPGVYMGTYRIIEGDNIIGANLVGYLKDSSDNESFMVASRSVNIDTTPGITIISPTSSSVDNPFQTVTGVIDDLRFKNILLQVNEVINTVPVVKGYFSFDIKLKEGKNVIEARFPNSSSGKGAYRIELNFVQYKDTGPKVTILYPQDGQIVDIIKSPVIKIRGTVSDPRITKAKLISNGIAMDINVKNGEFSQEVITLADVNSYLVEVVNKSGVGGLSNPITIKTVGLKKYDALISLTWDTPKAELDLELESPRGKSLSYKSRSYSMPGAKIEMYTKKDLVCQEIISLRETDAGMYSLVVVNYDPHPANATINIIFKDPKDSNKVNNKIFGPKIVSFGNEWQLDFVCLPEDTE